MSNSTFTYSLPVQNRINTLIVKLFELICVEITLSYWFLIDGLGISIHDMDKLTDGLLNGT